MWVGGITISGESLINRLIQIILVGVHFRWITLHKTPLSLCENIFDLRLYQKCYLDSSIAIEWKYR